MPLPTTGIYFSESFPAAPPGDQVCQPQSDGATPEQSVTFVPQQATLALRGTVKPDGTSIIMDPDGTLHAPGVGGGTGGGTGGGSASGGLYVVVSPTPDPMDGTRTQWILPAPQLAGTIGQLNRNDTIQRQLGTKAYYSVQGTQLTLTKPLEADGYLEYYYIQGVPNNEGGGGGGVTTSTSVVIRGQNTATGNGSPVTVAFPAGTQAGDLAILLVGGFGTSTPAGWTTLTFIGGGTSFMFSKVLTSGDISTGSVSTSASGAAILQIVTLAGGTTTGVREANGSGGTSGFPATSLPTTSAVQSGELCLSFGATFSPIGVLAIAVAPGTLLQSVSDVNALGIIADAAMASGTNTMTFTAAGTGSSTGGGVAIVIVKP